MTSFLISQQLAALRLDEFLAEAARRRLARAGRSYMREQRRNRRLLSTYPAASTDLERPAQREADPELVAP
jgi:hypothetical protein